MRGHHLADGLCFRRLINGYIAIEKFAPPYDDHADPEWSVRVAPSDFASVMAALTWRGETIETWQQSLKILLEE